MHVQFGRFEYRDSPITLRRGSKALKLQQQPARLLELLLSRPGEVITRDELRAHLWGDDVFLEHEQGINFAVRQVRKALADDPDAPDYIETVPRRGYRFIADVAPVQNGGAEPRASRSRSRLVAALALGGVIALTLLWLAEVFRPPGDAETAPPKLAVLKFEALARGLGDTMPALFDDSTGRDGVEAIAEALSEELITELASAYAAHIGIIEFASSGSLTHDGSSDAEVASRLGADFLLQGSVSRPSDRVLRITARLWSVRDRTHLWAETYETRVGGVQETLGSLAGAVAAQLGVDEVRPRTPPYAGLPEPLYKRYLQGRLLTYGGAVRNDIDMFQRGLVALEAVADQAPDFARGQAVLALANLMASSVGDFKVSMLAAERAANRALAIDPGLAEAYPVRAIVRMMLHYDWDGAASDFSTGVTLGPGLAKAHQLYACYLSAIGDHDRAIAEIRQAMDLDPLSFRVRFDRLQILYRARRYPETLAAAEEFLEEHPRNPFARLYVTYSLIDLGRRDEAARYLRETVWPADADTAGLDAMLLAYARELAGASSQADQMETLKAAAWARAGESELALESLERACREQRDWDLPFVTVDPSFDRLRDRPEYASLQPCLAPVG